MIAPVTGRARASGFGPRQPEGFSLPHRSHLSPSPSGDPAGTVPASDVQEQALPVQTIDDHLRRESTTPEPGPRADRVGRRADATRVRRLAADRAGQRDGRDEEAVLRPWSSAAKAWILDDYVFVAMEGGLTRNEETLLADGKEDLVRDYRLSFQETVAATRWARCRSCSGGGAHVPQPGRVRSAADVRDLRTRASVPGARQLEQADTKRLFERWQIDHDKAAREELVRAVSAACPQSRRRYARARSRSTTCTRWPASGSSRRSTASTSSAGSRSRRSRCRRSSASSSATSATRAGRSASRAACRSSRSSRARRRPAQRELGELADGGRDRRSTSGSTSSRCSRRCRPSAPTTPTSLDAPRRPTRTRRRPRRRPRDRRRRLRAGRDRATLAA